MRTAERETWEESGYRVSIGQLLATVRNGFRIYRRGHCCGWGREQMGSHAPLKRRIAGVHGPSKPFFFPIPFPLLLISNHSNLFPIEVLPPTTGAWQKARS